MRTDLTNENTFTVSRIGSAAEADKKINLALKISVIVYALEESRKATQRRPADARGDGLPPATGLSVALSAGRLSRLGNSASLFSASGSPPINEP